MNAFAWGLPFNVDKEEKFKAGLKLLVTQLIASKSFKLSLMSDSSQSKESRIHDRTAFHSDLTNVKSLGSP